MCDMRKVVLPSNRHTHSCALRSRMKFPCRGFRSVEPEKARSIPVTILTCRGTSSCENSIHVHRPNYASLSHTINGNAAIPLTETHMLAFNQLHKIIVPHHDNRRHRTHHCHDHSLRPQMSIHRSWRPPPHNTCSAVAGTAADAWAAVAVGSCSEPHDEMVGLKEARCQRSRCGRWPPHYAWSAVAGSAAWAAAASAVAVASAAVAVVFSC
ncbi:hypothetical protein C0Q70_01643 [Pomacea canaliculata]|uniref:Uncharacterized protein n=1 Tax=Pomacea canaliculata TaxID=400727 RepID=A0A2T7Q012_POMCA|nr:hypothetical protein C0Q70_01643 [Pomacea canaliculata]